MSQAGIINVVGSNPTIPIYFDGDTGTAVALFNVINFVGAGGITTSASGNTVTIDGSSVSNITLTGNSGGAITPTLGNFNIVTSNSTVTFQGSGSTLFLDFNVNNMTFGSALPNVTTGDNNTSVGYLTLDLLTSGFGNNIFGAYAGSSLTSGTGNCGYGTSTLSQVTVSSNNSGFGSTSLANLVSGTGNSALGNSSGGSLLTGDYNLFLGYNSGSLYTTSESSNILLSHVGVAAESNTIRIGTSGSGSGQQNRSFMAGITGVTVAASAPVGIASTGQLSSLGFGSSSQVLTSTGAGSSPTWQAIPSIGTITQYNVLVGGSGGLISSLSPGTTNTVLRSGGASANPAYSTNFKISSSDVMTNTSQPAFLAYNANAVANVTGDGTVYTCQFDTESFDNANNFSSNTFTAPVAGRYSFSAGMYVSGLAAHTLVTFQLVTSGGVKLFFLFCNPSALQNGSVLITSGAAVISMAAGETCNIVIYVSGSTKTISWGAGALNGNPPYFSGFLVG